MKRDLLCILDFSGEEILELFYLTRRLKERWKAGRVETALQGKTLGLLFEKPSTRTRVSFEVAAYQLGGACIYLTTGDTQLSRDETPEDTARVLARYLDILAVRTYRQEWLENMARFSRRPVINALTDRFHPCQALSDVYTVFEKRGSLDGLRAAWVGDGNNVAHSWINAAARLGFELTLACPEGYDPDPDILRSACRENPSIRIVRNPKEAVKGCHVINTDVWVSMGQDDEAEDRLKVFQEYQVNPGLAALALPDVMVLHCLPAHRGQEITADFLDDPNAVVWDQAENKMHFHKAILLKLSGGELD